MMKRATTLLFLILLLSRGESCAQEGVGSAGKRQIDFALGLHQRGDYKDALAEFEVYLKNPEWKEQRDLALFFAGEAAIKSGDPSGGLPFFESLATEFPESSYRKVALYRCATIHIEARQGKKAVEELHPLANEDLPKELETGVWYSLGAAYSLIGDSSRSIEWWNRVYQQTPDSPEGLRALVGMGFEAARSEDCGNATHYLREWISKADTAQSSSYPEALKRLADCEERLGEGGAALKRWITLLEVEAASGYWEEGIVSGLRISFELPEWKTFDQLSKRAETVLKSPASRIEWRVLTGARAYQDKKWREAFQLYAQAMEEAKSLPQEDASRLSETLDRLRIRAAWCAFALENWKEVETVLAGLGEGPRSTDEARYLLGEAARNLEKWESAKDLLSQVSEASEFKREARSGEADAAYRGNDWGRAARLYEELALKAKESEETSLYYLRAAEARRRMEEWTASAVLAASAAAETRSPEIRDSARYLEGWTRLRAGENSEAIQALKTWIEEFSGSEKTPEALALLAQGYRRVADMTRECEVLERLVTEFPESLWSADGLLNLAAAYSARSNRAGILKSLVRYQQRYPNTPLHTDYALWLAEELIESGSAEPAAGTLQYLLSRDLKEAERERCKFLLASAYDIAGQSEKGLEAYETHLAEYPESRYRLDALLGAAACAKKVGNRALAQKRVEEGMSLAAKSGGEGPELETRLFLLAGDLAYASEDYQTAYRYYARPGILYRHPEWTPLALEKSALCKDRLGEPEKARELRDEILRDFPGYRLGAR